MYRLLVLLELDLFYFILDLIDLNFIKVIEHRCHQQTETGVSYVEWPHKKKIKYISHFGSLTNYLYSDKCLCGGFNQLLDNNFNPLYYYGNLIT